MHTFAIDPVYYLTSNQTKKKMNEHVQIIFKECAPHKNSGLTVCLSHQ